MGEIINAFNTVYADGPSMDPAHPEKRYIRPLGGVIEGAIDDLATNVQAQLDDFEVDADSVTKGTWTEMSGVIGTRNGQKGTVTNDAGTHTDPVTGATVSNRGTYSWSVSPAGWKWVGADDYGSVVGLGSEIGLSDSYSIGVINWDSSILTDGSGNPIGLSFAVGQNGVDGSNIANILISDTYVAAKKGAGAKVRTAFYLDISASFARVTTPFMFVTRNGVLVALTVSGSVSDATQFRVVNNVLIGQRRFYELEWMLDGTETGISAQVRFTGPDAVASETVQFSGVIATKVSAAGSPDFSIFDLALATANKTTRRLAVAEAIARIFGSIPYVIEKTLALSGGDYSTVQTANNGVGSGTVAEPKAIRIKPGVYQNLALTTTQVWRAYLDWIGPGGDRAVIEQINPDDTAVANTVSDQPILSWYTATYRDFSGRVKNARYVIHSDSDGTRVDQKFTYENLHLEHLGNQGAIDYQTSLGGGGNPSGVWAQDNCRPIGIGTSSGNEYVIRGCTLRGPRSVIGVHDNKDFSKPNRVLIEDCDLICTEGHDNARALVLGAFGSGQVSTIEVVGCRSNGDVVLYGMPWLSVAADTQPADPFTQLVVSGHGNSPMVSSILVNSTPQRALKIASANTTAASSVTISGTQSLLDALFGTVYSRKGGGGLPGQVWGYNNIAEMGVGAGAATFVTALGKRLGNRTGSPWTLSVSFQGGAAINITFNTDYTNVSNASILSTINAALGAAGVASEYNIAARHRPRFADEERSFAVTAATSIPIWSWMAYDGSRNKGRLMTSADALSLSAGVAYGDDIVTGGAGRVKTRGLFGVADIIINGGPTINFGDLLEIDASNPGQFVKNNASTRAVLRSVRANTFERV